MNKEKSDIRTVKHLPKKDVRISDPRARLKDLSDRASTVEVDCNIPPQRYHTLLTLYTSNLTYQQVILILLVSLMLFRYYRSGVEMIRLANMYMTENNPEYAYKLYVKFITYDIFIIFNKTRNSIYLSKYYFFKKYFIIGFLWKKYWNIHNFIQCH